MRSEAAHGLGHVHGQIKELHQRDARDMRRGYVQFGGLAMQGGALVLVEGQGDLVAVSHGGSTIPG